MKKREFFIFILFFAIDRITKTISIIFFHPTKNSGSLFGMLKSGNQAFILISIAFLFLLILLFIKSKLNKTGLLLIITGILSNLTDRIFYGHVIDFIDLKIWPIFNISDSMIVIGAIILAYQIIRNKKWQ